MDEKEMTVGRGMTDMTQGTPWKLILMFSLPLLAGNILQQLYNMVDSMVVGNYVGKAALAAVGAGFPITFMVGALFIGLSMGATIMIAQYYGAGDMEKVARTVDTAYTALLVGSIPLAIVGMLICGPLLRITRTPPDAYPLAWLYLVILFGGVIGNLGYNINTGILQGLGDSRTPLLFLAIATLLNIVLDLLFVARFHWGVAGVAIATVIAQATSWIFGLVHINRKYPAIRIRLRRLRFDKELFAQMIRLGVPVGIQQSFFAIGEMAIQAIINDYGSGFMAGVNGANKLDTFAFMPIQSFATAATTFVGQNIGAGRADRVHRGTVATLTISISFGLVAGVLLIVFAPYLMSIFSQDQEVIAAGCAYLYRILPFYWMLAITFTLTSIIRGAGSMVVPTLASIFSLWLARVPAAYVLAHFFGRDNIFFCYAVGWVMGLAILCPYYFFGRWKEKKLT